MVADPLRLFDCSPVSDGAAALMLVSDRVRKEHKNLLASELVGSRFATDTISLQNRKDICWLRASELASKQAFKDAGISVKDIDDFNVHDAFTIMAALSLESFGVVPQGKATDLVKEGKIGPEKLFDTDLYDPKTKNPHVDHWLRDTAYDHDHEHHPDVNRHGSDIQAFCLTYEEPLPWAALRTWLESVISLRGSDVLRIKGIVNVSEADGPVIVHGVQHIFHSPTLIPVVSQHYVLDFRIFKHPSSIQPSPD